MGLLDGLTDAVFGEDSEDVAKQNAKQSIKQAQKYYDKFLKQFIQPAQDREEMLWDVALGYAKDIPGMIGTGFDTAQRALSRYGAAAQGDILDQGDELVAGMDQRFASSGLYGSTGHAGAVSGISAGTQRALAALSASVGQESAGLERQRTGALVGANQNLASMYQNRAGHDLSFLGTQLNAANQAPVFANPGGLPNFMQAGIGLVDSLVPG
jgi:hypothetical protein